MFPRQPGLVRLDLARTLDVEAKGVAPFRPPARHRLAEIAGQYLKKGRAVYIEGGLRTRKWTNKEGVEQYTTEIRADQMQMLGGREGGDAPMRSGQDGDESMSRGGNSGSGNGGNSRPPARENRNQESSNSAPPANAFGGDFDDDIPF